MDFHLVLRLGVGEHSGILWTLVRGLILPGRLGHAAVLFESILFDSKARSDARMLNSLVMFLHVCKLVHYLKASV